MTLDGLPSSEASSSPTFMSPICFHPSMASTWASSGWAFPILGLAARTIKSERWKPASKLSRSLKPVGIPRIFFLSRCSASKRSKLVSRICSRLTTVCCICCWPTFMSSASAISTSSFSFLDSSMASAASSLLTLRSCRRTDFSATRSA